MTIPHQSIKGHIVALPLLAWGHTKPLCAFLAKVVRLRPVHATLFTDGALREKVLDEVARQFDTERDESLKNLIRVVALPTPKLPFKFDVFLSSFDEAYKALCDGKYVPMAPGSNLAYEPVPVPQAAPFFYEALKTVRSISGAQVSIYAWQTIATASCFYYFAPEELGGSGDLAKRISEVMATVEDPEVRDKEIIQTLRNIKNELIKIPGLPPMYDYEKVPQIAAVQMNPVEFAIIIQHSHRFFQESDGVIHTTNAFFEGSVLNKWQEWYGSKPVIAVAPLSPPASAADIERERSKSPIGAEVEQFLNNTLDKFGPNSVVFISFGTMWWSSEPEKIWTVIDVLIDQGIPFLISHASPVAVIPDEVSNKIKTSGLGYIAKWLPQQVILRHKATGWFVSHCGHNSVMESLTAGIPLICWPYDADQPMNAANIAFTHEVGYELFEVRTGHGLKPIHRLGDKAPSGTLDAVRQEALDVFTKAFGEDGQVKRAKAQWFSEQFAKIWEEGGTGWSELKRIVDKLD